MKFRNTRGARQRLEREFSPRLRGLLVLSSLPQRLNDFPFTAPTSNLASISAFAETAGLHADFCHEEALEQIHNIQVTVPWKGKGIVGVGEMSILSDGRWIDVSVTSARLCLPLINVMLVSCVVCANTCRVVSWQKVLCFHLHQDLNLLFTSQTSVPFIPDNSNALAELHINTTHT